MLFRLLLVICLFGIITNLIIKDYSFRFNIKNDTFLLSNRNIKNEQMHIKLPDIIFISIIILLFIILLICLYYQLPIVNFIFTRCSKTKNNDDDINEHIIILHRISPLKNITSMYLTVPQPSYLYQ